MADAIFYLGHQDDPDIYLMYYEAIQWALGLTEAGVTPQPMPAAVAK